MLRLRARSDGATAMHGLWPLAFLAFLLPSAAPLVNAAAKGAGCSPPHLDFSKYSYKCMEVKKACLDQNTIIYWDSERHPSNTLDVYPQFNLSGLVFNLPSRHGIGDRFKKGASMKYPDIWIRPAHIMEESEDVQHPVFSNCTLPLLFWSLYPFSPADAFKMALEKLHGLYKRGAFDRRVTLVPVLPHNSRMPGYMRLWYQPLSMLQITTLSDLSQRRPPGARSNSTAEGLAHRCFERVMLCRLGTQRVPASYYSAGQFVWRSHAAHVRKLGPSYAARFAPLRFPAEDTDKNVLPYDKPIEHDVAASPPAAAADAGADVKPAGKSTLAEPADPYMQATAETVVSGRVSGDGVMRVVFASRASAHVHAGRSILNEAELLRRCNDASQAGLGTLPPGSAFKTVQCFKHVFGDDLQLDLWLMRRVDVLVGVHGATLTNALYMRPGGALIEVRPYNFTGKRGWADRYMRFQSGNRMETPWRVFWFGIDIHNTSAWTAGMFEADFKEHFTKMKSILARDRNVIIAWPALRHALRAVAVTSRRVNRYLSLRYSGAYYITDLLQQAELPGKDKYGVGKGMQSQFTDLEEELTKAGAIALDALLNFRLQLADAQPGKQQQGIGVRASTTLSVPRGGGGNTTSGDSGGSGGGGKADGDGTVEGAEAAAAAAGEGEGEDSRAGAAE